MSATLTVDVLARIGGTLLEGPAWDARNARLLLVDIRGRRRHALDWAGGMVTTHRAEETTSAWIPRATGGTVVACRRGLRLADEDGEGALALEIEADRPEHRTNDAKCDPGGRLWVGTMTDAGDVPHGALYRVGADLSLVRALEGTTISNGMGWSPDDRRMYFADSPTRRIDVFAFDRATGSASERRTFVDVAAFRGIPDGLTVDAEGCLWVAMYDGGAVLRFAPDGAHLATLEMPVARPTSCCFAGPGLDRLVITTARDGDGSGGDLYVCDADVTGTPTVPFAG